MKAVFLDRDGVLVEDVDCLVDAAKIRLLPGVPEALNRLQLAGYRLVVVSNQPVVARGMTDEAGVRAIQAEIERQICALGGPRLDGFYFCPHHPKADLPAYRCTCACRKPSPGMLQQAAAELGLEFGPSYMVGDRISDVAAGTRVGCRTVLLETGMHTAPPVSGMTAADLACRPNHTCAGLPEAVEWILRQADDAPPHAHRAMVLCAGYGTRLGDLTKEMPKPMLPVAGRPMLEHIIRRLVRHGFRQIAINLHFHPEIIQDYFQDGKAWGAELVYSYEPELLGTAGGVRQMGDFLAGGGTFLVQYGDVVTDQNLGLLLAAHRQKQAQATLLLHQRAKSNSIVCLDDNQRITQFLERPDEATRARFNSPWVNSGLCLCEPEVLSWIPPGTACDLPRNVFSPRAATSRFYGVPLTGWRVAVDSPQRLEECDRRMREEMRTLKQ